MYTVHICKPGYNDTLEMRLCPVLHGYIVERKMVLLQVDSISNCITWSSMSTHSAQYVPTRAREKRQLKTKRGTEAQPHLTPEESSL